MTLHFLYIIECSLCSFDKHASNQEALMKTLSGRWHRKASGINKRLVKLTIGTDKMQKFQPLVIGWGGKQSLSVTLSNCVWILSAISALMLMRQCIDAEGKRRRNVEGGGREVTSPEKYVVTCTSMHC